MATIPIVRSTIASSSRSTLIRNSTIIPRTALPRITSQQLISPTLLRQSHILSRFPSSVRSFSSSSLIRAAQSQSQTINPSSTKSQSQSNHQESEEPESDEPPPNASVTQRLKILFKKYGWYALGIYTLLSTIDCSLAFLAVHTLGAEKIEPVFDGLIGYYRKTRYGEEEALKMKGIDDQKKYEEQAQLEKDRINGVVQQEKNQWFGKTFWAELALAYAIHKTLLLPVRAGLTVAWTPKIVNWLTSRGWVGKGGLTRAATHAQGKVKDASERVKDRVKRQ